MPIPRTTDRTPRGVLLLVVLSMLTLFMLLGMTYLVLASRTRATSKAFLRLADEQARTGLALKPFLRDAALQVIRGTDNERSPLKYHDLLADRYGDEAKQFTVSSQVAAAGGLLKLQLPLASSPADGPALCGRVLTFDDGPAAVKDMSTRIVDAWYVDPTDLTKGSWVMVERPAGLTSLASTTRVSINPRDFSGEGFSPASTGVGKTTLDDSSLLPNRAFGYDFQGLTADPSLADKFNKTQANEDYDAIDEQNWALSSADGSIRSFQRLDVLKLWIRDHAIRAASGNAPLRQVLQEVLTSAKSAHLEPPLGLENVRTMLRLRRATLRPFAFDHYQDDARTTDFTGRPLSMADTLLAPPGDVDTDGDGSLDSIWLDLGFSPLRTEDRKLVKPLFAIRCVDLGGRVNLNAHGSPLDAVEAAAAPTPDLAPLRNDDGSQTTPTAATLRTGLGFGPADIRLDAVLATPEITALMLGSQSMGGSGQGICRDLGAIVGRYGDGVGTATSVPRPGTPSQIDRADGGQAGVPETYWSTNAGIGAYGRFGGGPPDFWSRLAVGIDHRGHPSYVKRAAGLTLLENTDNPYELNLFVPKSGNAYAQPTTATPAVRYEDQPFTAAELEGILRPFDFDNAAALPPRGLALALTGASSNLLDTMRTLVTTESWDTPAVVGVTDYVNLFADELRFDADLAKGLKMDLNRPFGDGRDNNNNGVIDEPVVLSGGTAVRAEPKDDWTSSDDAVPLIRAKRYPQAFVYLRQPGPDTDQLRARQLYAYHLYNVLSTLYNTFASPSANANDPGLRLFHVLADTGTAGATPQAADQGLMAANPSTTASLQTAHNRRVLAQWAVNVVDFLDGDAIMTPFRYDAPTNPTANPTEYVVWGCEHPDLMVTETLAFHDRRTADTACDITRKTAQQYAEDYQNAYQSWLLDDTNPRPKPLDPDGNPASVDDPDFDQVRIPQGSLFLELYATRDPNLPSLPRELYSYQSGRWVLDLDRVPTDGTAPVWRLSISANNADRTGNDVFAKLAAKPDTEWLSPGTDPSLIADQIAIDRYVWLTAQEPPAAGAGPTVNNTFYVRPESGAAPPKLPAGGYLVVGPRKTTAIGSVSSGGSQKWGVRSPQRIELTAAPGRAVSVYGLDSVPNPTVSVPNDAKFGSALPPASLPETIATWVAQKPPSTDAWREAGSMPGVTHDGIGLNVSEPLRSDYYATPPTFLNRSLNVYDAYGPLEDDTHDLFPTLPFDRSGTPLSGHMLSGGSFANFCAVFVERLADPTRPHEPDATKPTWNPYVVVDFMPVDLTVFNGESQTPDPSETQGWDRGLNMDLPVTLPPDALPPDFTWVPLPAGDSNQLAARQTYFHTRQRGFGSDLPRYENEATLFGSGMGVVARNPHPYKPIGSLLDIAAIPLRRTGVSVDPLLPGGCPTTPNTKATVGAFFAHELGQSPSGRLANRQAWKSVPFHSLGWVNPSFGRRLDAADGVPDAYVGCPDRPFPWIVWNDRPFANPYELVYVPRTPPARLFTNYRNLDYPNVDRNQAQPSTEYQTSDNSVTSPYNSKDMFGAGTAGSHLLPLTSVTDIPLTPLAGSRHANVFSRIFDFVRVPSPFTGTDHVLAGTSPVPLTGGTDATPSRFQGPFNRVTTYREPGRVNVNTISTATSSTATASDPDFFMGSVVWNAICGAVQQPAEPPFATILKSATVSFGANLATDGWYRRPLRTTTGSKWRPDFIAATVPGAQANAGFPQSRLLNPEFEFTETATPWYRSATGNLVADDKYTARAFTLLGDQPPTAAGTRGVPLFEPPTVQSWATDSRRNEWFRFQTLVRANAHATVRSEVYAIWVTMGLFDVEDSPKHYWHYLTETGQEKAELFLGGKESPAYPDGKRLVREHGSETGAVTRHRAFFIFDRSVPIKYSPGANTNVENGIIAERVIE